MGYVRAADRLMKRLWELKSLTFCGPVQPRNGVAIFYSGFQMDVGR